MISPHPQRPLSQSLSKAARLVPPLRVCFDKLSTSGRLGKQTVKQVSECVL